MLRRSISTVIVLIAGSTNVSWAQTPDPIHEPYLLDKTLQTRSISFENPTGEAGSGGKAASNLGVGARGTEPRHQAR